MRPIDLNLIRTFVTLYESGSVTLAAHKLNVTQPSVSYSLSRLRELFDDPLFSRTRDGMAPTFCATQLYASFRHALTQIEHTIGDHQHFDPRHSQRRFRLALTDLGETTLLPVILQRIQTLAPYVELEVVPLEIEKINAWFDNKSVDAVVCSRDIMTPSLGKRVILEERYVCLLNAQHPRIEKTLDMNTFTHEHHIVVSPSSGHGLAEDVLKKHDISRKVSVVVPHFSALPRILENSELLTILPEQIARIFTREAALQICELPFDVPNVEVALYWPRHADDSSAQEWFRQTLIEAIAPEHDTQGPSGEI
ncbi:DNA-binding transcriptional LysR family regulator [Chromohalobacter marismortui]|uniref:DNA-binding transcriptional LysR family regulator n=1 Tax=Chromohalobacter marismortui TaxID=42055 RepID=A0A4R7NM91_9GAMM|nr:MULTISPECIES: LysR family transcriptional regulator [Chromohalobacter]MCI0509703.1 LysR family transcriptional regulator [Chromohalobacter sp.]MCI0593334.1 LysR family transcriptional regulator [Chromohalobacter sp.]TDU21925.1 DNA-binding transcriptional LysR family regulator [Chromohalobacter marismortui]